MSLARRLLQRAMGTTLVPVAAPVEAKDLLDWVIEAVDPTLAPARPLIECLAGGGDANTCAVEAAKKQATGALPIGPDDDRVKRAVEVFEAARDERWFDVVTIGGEVVAKMVSCAVLPIQGPLKGPACSIVGWVISKNAKLLDQAYQALTGPTGGRWSSCWAQVSARSFLPTARPGRPEKCPQETNATPEGRA